MDILNHLELQMKGNASVAGQTADYAKIESEIYRQKSKLNSLIIMTSDANAKIESRVNNMMRNGTTKQPIVTGRNAPCVLGQALEDYLPVGSDNNYFEGPENSWKQ